MAHSCRLQSVSAQRLELLGTVEPRQQPLGLRASCVRPSNRLPGPHLGRAASSSRAATDCTISLPFILRRLFVPGSRALDAIDCCFSRLLESIYLYSIGVHLTKLASTIITDIIKPIEEIDRDRNNQSLLAVSVDEMDRNSLLASRWLLVLL